MTVASKVPDCPACGTKMRPAGSTYVCEGCGKTAPNPDQAIAETEPRKRPQAKRIRKRDSWLRDRYDPTKEDTQKWKEIGFPSHVDIVAGFLMSNNLVFGVPDKAELFRLDKLTREGDRTFGGA